MKQEPSRGQVAGNVSAAEVVRAVRDMLAAAGLPMGADQTSLLERSLALQEQLTAVDTALIEEQVCFPLLLPCSFYMYHNGTQKCLTLHIGLFVC